MEIEMGTVNMAENMSTENNHSDAGDEKGKPDTPEKEEAGMAEFIIMMIAGLLLLTAFIAVACGHAILAFVAAAMALDFFWFSGDMAKEMKKILTAAAFLAYAMGNRVKKGLPKKELKKIRAHAWASTIFGILATAFLYIVGGAFGFICVACLTLLSALCLSMSYKCFVEYPAPPHDNLTMEYILWHSDETAP